MLDFFVVEQLKKWITLLSKYEEIVFFLDEDTHPLGTFFIHLSKIFPYNARTVCIQHGLFFDTYYQIRKEGELSDINFVWDENQIPLIKKSKENMYVLGLAYNASAKVALKKTVYFIGTGMYNSGKDYDSYIIDAYAELSRELSKRKINNYYLPHPNEYNSIRIKNLKKIFKNVAVINKVDLLNDRKGIFVGVESSLLYEAYIANHSVIRLKVDNTNFTFKTDFIYSANNSLYDDVINWIELDNLFPHSHNTNCKKNPLHRFQECLELAKIIYP